MQLGRIGGLLLSGGTVLLVMGYLLMVQSRTVGRLAGDLASGTALLLIGAGAAVLCVAGSKPFEGRTIRFGLGTIAVGLVGLQGASVIAATLTYDPLENWPFVLVGLGSVLASAVGLLAAIVALLRAGGRARAVGLLLLAGPALFFAAGTIGPHVTELPLQVVTGGVALLGALGFALGGIWLGVLAVKGDDGAPTASV